MAAARPEPTRAAQADHVDRAPVVFRRERRRQWDWTALAGPSPYGRYYHDRLASVYRTLVPAGLRVLEVGCGRGDLLHAVAPRWGVGIDFSEAMVAEAARRHPSLRFVIADAHHLPVRGTFDVVILSDLLNDVWDAQAILEGVKNVCAPHTRVILNVYNRAWELPLALAQRIRMATPRLQQNWFSVGDLRNLLALTGFELIRTFGEILWPFGTPGLAAVVNRVAARIAPFNRLTLTNVIVARPIGLPRTSMPRVTVVVPARNEAGHISSIVARVPQMGASTQVIFVEGHSSDATFEAIEAAIAPLDRSQYRLLRQPGTGKGDAVRLGFREASGDVLMILDADLTVPPEDLPRFYDALVSGKGEFINGVRLVYPMEGQAMRFANLVANKSFSAAFSWLLGQPVKDTLCGTKVLWREDYAGIARGRGYFGDVDPFGDFDLLFGAARMNLRIVDLPVRYRARGYGQTNIRRWRHGWLLVRMAALGARRLKFV